MKKLLLIISFLFLSNIIYSQTIECNDQDICVVEFNAGWNEANSCKWLDKLNDCGVKRISIDKGEWKEKFKIFVVPTIIIFNGEEVERYQADLSFKLSATIEEVQEKIDETIMEAF